MENGNNPSGHSEPTASRKSIAAKLVAVMKEVGGYIQVDSRNTTQSYNYVSDKAVKEKVSAALAEHGLAFFTSDEGMETTKFETKKGAVQWMVTVTVRWTLVDSQSGEELSGVYHGTGADSLDKGLYKAYTGGGKAFWKRILQIGSGDDPDEDVNSRESQEEIAERKLANLKKKEAMKKPADGKVDLGKMVGSIASLKDQMKVCHPRGEEEGEREYYDILSQFGAGHANHKGFMSDPSKARACYKAVLAAVNAHKEAAKKSVTRDDWENAMAGSAQ